MEMSARSVTRSHGQRRLRYAGLLLAGWAAAGCGGLELNADHPDLGRTATQVTYQGKPFTGTLKTRLPALGQINRDRYKDGFRHGVSIEELENGQRIARRRYFRGIKHGVHRTWFRNGKPRSYARFRVGIYHGYSWAWHDNGRPSDYILYDNEGRAMVAKRWRPNGLIYMNTAFLKGDALGLPPSKVCDPVGPARGKPRK